MAEALLRHRLDALEVDIDVASAGFTTTGRPAGRKAVKALNRLVPHLGAELESHSSEVLTSERIDEAMIVVGMTRKHLADVIALSEEAFERCFTLKELVTRGVEVGPLADDESAGDWIKKVHDGRDSSAYLGAGPDTDIDDPVGRSTRYFNSTAADIDRLVNELIKLWWPEL